MVLIKCFRSSYASSSNSYLHSNMVLIKFNVDNTVVDNIILFTFQYGSNQIAWRLHINILSTKFTFQYGSNQIKLCTFLVDRSSSFTFQYGSNQIHSSSIA